MKTTKIDDGVPGTIVDVRTPAEFSQGNVSGSVNIPLQEIQIRIDEFKSLKQPLVLCCASGGRSRQATQYLIHNGIACQDGGSWLNLIDNQINTI